MADDPITVELDPTEAIEAATVLEGVWELGEASDEVLNVARLIRVAAKGAASAIVAVLLLTALVLPGAAAARQGHYHLRPVFRKHFVWAGCAVIFTATPVGQATGATGATDVAVTHCWGAGMRWVDPPGYTPPGTYVSTPGPY